MPGSSTTSAKLSVRVPLDLAEWIATQAGSQSDVIVRALRALKDGVTGDGPDQRAVVLQTMVANLEAENARLTQERDQWRDRAKAIVQAGANKEPLNAVATKTIGHHPAGPVYEPKLKVQGTAQPRFRPGTTADKATR
jgi:hypothetical protein